MEEDNSDGMMELTSQGAGTYWYLPPECFEKSGTSPPRISTKVDVWSAGIIWYQLLYGERPFGEGMGQEQMYLEKTINKGVTIEFPDKIKVSEEVKELVRQCLAPSQDDRPTIGRILTASYFANPVKGKKK